MQSNELITYDTSGVVVGGGGSPRVSPFCDNLDLEERHFSHPEEIGSSTLISINETTRKELKLR